MNSKLQLCVIQYGIGQEKVAVERNSQKREYIEKKSEKNSYLVRQKCLQ